MEVIEENMRQKEMLEDPGEQDPSEAQQRVLTPRMRQWLDGGDNDHMAMLRSENAALIKQVKAQEKRLSESQQAEAESCRSLLADDLRINRCSAKKIQELEEKCSMMKEQNKKLTEEIQSLQQDRDRDRISLSKFRITLQTLECRMEEAQFGVQSREEVINQKNMQIKHLEETVEECSNSIEYLRLINQELREHLEDRLDEASLTIMNELLEDKEGAVSPSPSLAEEIKLLASSAVLETIVSDSTDVRLEETKADLLVDPQRFSADLQTKRCAGILQTAHKTEGPLLFLIILTVVVLVASVNFATLWNSARLMFQPYCTVHYGDLPPI